MFSIRYTFLTFIFIIQLFFYNDWMNGDWIMYEVPHDPEVSDTFGRLGLRLKRDRFYRSMKNVTLLRVNR